jgi:hypothetical protein
VDEWGGSGRQQQQQAAAAALATCNRPSCLNETDKLKHIQDFSLVLYRWGTSVISRWWRLFYDERTTGGKTSSSSSEEKTKP